jgi:hypothetical protein
MQALSATIDATVFSFFAVIDSPPVAICWFRATPVPPRRLASRAPYGNRECAAADSSGDLCVSVEKGGDAAALAGGGILARGASGRRGAFKSDQDSRSLSFSML